MARPRGPGADSIGQGVDGVQHGLRAAVVNDALPSQVFPVHALTRVIRLLGELNVLPPMSLPA